jgi:hypothetical protein
VAPLLLLLLLPVQRLVLLAPCKQAQQGQLHQEQQQQGAALPVSSGALGRTPQVLALRTRSHGQLQQSRAWQQQQLRRQQWMLMLGKRGLLL